MEPPLPPPPQAPVLSELRPPEPPVSLALHEAAELGDDGAISALLDAGQADVDSKDRMGLSALHIAGP